MSGECRAGEPHCITCGDEGTVMRVIERRDGVAVCADEGNAHHQVATDLVEPIEPGDLVLVHAGVAIGHLEAASA